MAARREEHRKHGDERGYERRDERRYEPQHRDSSAQKLHTQLLESMKYPTEENFTKLSDILTTANDKVLRTLSYNGFSHLMDVIHLTQSMCPQEVRSAEITLSLFKVFMEKVSAKIKTFLLITPCNNGLNPLHQILYNGDKELLEAYLAELNTLLEDHTLSLEQYSQILMQTTNLGYSTLNQASQSYDTEKTKYYLEFLKQKVKEGKLQYGDYAQILTQKNEEGFNPGSSLLRDKVARRANLARREPIPEINRELEVENLITYLEELKTLVDSGNLSLATYVETLTQPSKLNFNPLHQAIMSQNTELLKKYLEYLEEAINNFWLSSKDLETILMLPAEPFLSTPLHLAARKNNSPEMAKTYIEFLAKLRENRWLNSEQYSKLWTLPDIYGFRPCQYALSRLTEKESQATQEKLNTAAEYYLEELEKAMSGYYLTKNAYLEALIMPNNRGETPLFSTLKSGIEEVVTAYLLKLQNLYVFGFVEKEAYQNILRQPDRSSWTPLHEAANIGNENILKAFFQALQYIFSTQELYELLYTKSRGDIPYCEQSNPNAEKINDFLNTKRLQLRSYLEEDSKYNPSLRFFKNPAKRRNSPTEHLDHERNPSKRHRKL